VDGPAEVSVPGLVGPGDHGLLDQLAGAERAVADLGCGDGKRALRLATADPAAVAVGVDAETTRLDRTLATARRRRLSNLFFLTWSLDRPLPALAGKFTNVSVIMPWGSLLDGVLGTDEQVLVNVLTLGRQSADLDMVINCRPWTAPDALDKKLASTPEPTEERLAAMRRQYSACGWQLGVPSWLTDDEARALGSSWASRVVSARASRLLQLQARRC
jgi:16S rRNA (adenine(1408)-N(1))-methyltransferase